MEKAFKPLAKDSKLVIQELNGEILIYDLSENRAFCLNETAALVWRACNGKHTVAEIGESVGNEDLVWLALDQLKKENLLSNKEEIEGKFEGLSRREVVKKVGFSSMLALPVIASLVAPVAAQTGTCPPPVNLPNGSACSRSCVCSSGCCKSNNSGGSGQNTCQTSGGAVVCHPF